ncbi:MAG TPA: sulfite exporter TauE/SafE family protein [Candidatus Bathyarchaeia archaeon]|nr:sulfite exporter TauE/SafE family protein [Candidatus Bathyarchaeia archaeon]
MELTLTVGLVIAALALVAEYMDSTLGMGYGTTLTPILLLMGYEPLQIVPAILVSELVTGLLAGFTHHYVGNVDFRPKTMNIVTIFRSIKFMGARESFVKGVPLALRVALLIGACSVVGSIAAIFVALSIPKFYLNLYIGVLILVIGFVIILTLKKEFRFSWKRTMALALVASFNKGMSGGGYGPVVTGGQVLAGVQEKNAVAITSLAEALTCAVGISGYFILQKTLDLQLAPFLVAGAIISVPFSALTVREINLKHMRLIIGIATIILGVMALVKLFMG